MILGVILFMDFIVFPLVPLFCWIKDYCLLICLDFSMFIDRSECQKRHKLLDTFRLLPHLFDKLQFFIVVKHWKGVNKNDK